MLGCCPAEKQAMTTTVAPTAEADCQLSAGCKAAGLHGQCCPNAAGIKLGCCDAPAPEAAASEGASDGGAAKTEESTPATDE